MKFNFDANIVTPANIGVTADIKMTVEMTVEEMTEQIKSKTANLTTLLGFLKETLPQIRECFMQGNEQDHRHEMERRAAEESNGPLALRIQYLDQEVSELRRFKSAQEEKSDNSFSFIPRFGGRS